MTEQQKTRMDHFSHVQPGDMISLSSAKVIDLVDLLYQLIARWKFIGCVAAAFAIAAGVYTAYFVTPLYQATSIIYVLSPESILNMSSLQLGTALTSDYIKVFDMWEVHEAVLTNLHLDYTYQQMRDHLSVTNSTGTRMLDISFTSPSPTEAAAIANEYAKVASDYIRETMSTDRPNLMSQALAPARPISPSRTRNILIGFALCGVLAAGIVTVRFLTDDKIKTAEDIRHCAGLVTLAVVPVNKESPSAPEDEEKQEREGESK